MDQTFFHKNALSLKPHVYFANSPHNEESLYNTKPLSKFGNYDNLALSFKNNNSINLTNEINKNGYRCDDFKYDHIGKHIVFTGCSYTFGSGLELNDTWAKKVYDKISNQEETSGYYNLGISGSSILNQVTDLFKYFYTYGNPDVIFICIPDFSRFYGYDLDKRKIVDGFYNHESQNIINLLSYQYYLMLFQYCRQSNIELITFSWYTVEDKFTTDFKKSRIELFDTFYNFNLAELNNFVKSFVLNNPNISNAEISMDGIHMGVAYHEFWSNFIYKEYVESK
jgi:hypothetical protein